MIRILADTRNAKQHWERRCDTLPFLEVPMSDGSVVRYYPEIPQPGLVKALEGIRRIGYQLKEAGDCGNNHQPYTRKIKPWLVYHRKEN